MTLYHDASIALAQTQCRPRTSSSTSIQRIHAGLQSLAWYLNSTWLPTGARLAYFHTFLLRGQGSVITAEAETQLRRCMPVSVKKHAFCHMVVRNTITVCVDRL